METPGHTQKDLIIIIVIITTFSSLGEANRMQLLDMRK